LAGMSNCPAKTVQLASQPTCQLTCWPGFF